MKCNRIPNRGENSLTHVFVWQFGCIKKLTEGMVICEWGCKSTKWLGVRESKLWKKQEGTKKGMGGTDRSWSLFKKTCSENFPKDKTIKAVHELGSLIFHFMIFILHLCKIIPHAGCKLSVKCATQALIQLYHRMWRVLEVIIREKDA